MLRVMARLIAGGYLAIVLVVALVYLAVGGVGFAPVPLPELVLDVLDRVESEAVEPGAGREAELRWYPGAPHTLAGTDAATMHQRSLELFRSTLNP
jgi:hypothetical protein